MAHVMIVDALAGRVQPGSVITLKGWVRTRRDSKAGLSFIHLHDGSCFGQLQIVAPKALPNYDSEVPKNTITSRCVTSGAWILFGRELKSKIMTLLLTLQESWTRQCLTL